MKLMLRDGSFSKDFYQKGVIPMGTKPKNKINDFLWDNRLTAGELADKLDLHPTTISRWRNGHKPIPKTIELALKALADQENYFAPRE